MISCSLPAARTCQKMVPSSSESRRARHRFLKKKITLYGKVKISERLLRSIVVRKFVAKFETNRDNLRMIVLKCGWPEHGRRWYGWV